MVVLGSHPGPGLFDQHQGTEANLRRKGDASGMGTGDEGEGEGSIFDSMRDTLALLDSAPSSPPPPPRGILQLSPNL